MSGIRLVHLAVFAGLTVFNQSLHAGDATVGAVRDERPGAVGKEREVTFDIWEIRVRGNTVLDGKLLERTVYPFLGARKTVRDVEAARQALERFYKESGYPTVIVNIPEQDVRNGVVRLQVIEGRVSRLRVSGSRYFSPDGLRAEVPALTPGEVPYLPAVQAQLRKVNAAMPDRRVTPVFRPGRTPGTVEVDLKVKDRLPVHADVEINGRSSANTSRTRMSGTLRYGNLWQKGHSASLMLMTAPENPEDVQVGALTYVLPASGGADVFAFYGVFNRSDVAAAGDITVLGNGAVVGMRLIRPLPSKERWYHNISLGLDYKDFEESLRPQGADRLDTPISYLAFQAEYRGSVGRPTGERTSFAGAAHLGVRGFGNTEYEFENKRYNASPNYLYLTGEIEHERRLAQRIGLNINLRAQLADAPLISNEQMSAGGSETVRGYYESQALGDYGLIGNVELRWNGVLPPRMGSVGRMAFYGFLDGAEVRLHDPLPGQSSGVELAGTGVGFRVKWAGTVADVTAGWALRDYGAIQRGDARIDFLLRFSF